MQSEAIKSEVLFFISHFSLGTCIAAAVVLLSLTQKSSDACDDGDGKNDYLSSSPWLLLNR